MAEENLVNKEHMHFFGMIQKCIVMIAEIYRM